jgi:hypothetical protein
VSILTGHIIDGIKSIFNESWKMCVEKKEADKYLMTFQNLLSSIPKWNNIIVQEERKRIIEKSGCNYLEELITCVHVIQLKVLTCIRVGNKQKKIDISIPNLDTFIHKVYIHVARKVYSNVYLFEKNITALSQQRNNRELEMIVQECILLSIRESIPTESIIRAYLDESVEEEQEVIIETMPTEEAIATNKEAETTETTEKEGEGKVSEPIKEEAPVLQPSVKDLDNEPVITRLTFNEYDSMMDTENNESKIHAPKNLERLEEISILKSMKNKMMETEEDEYGNDNNERLKIMESLDMDMDILDLDQSLEKSLSDDVPLLGDIIDLN